MKYLNGSRRKIAILLVITAIIGGGVFSTVKELSQPDYSRTLTQTDMIHIKESEGNDSGYIVDKQIFFDKDCGYSAQFSTPELSLPKGKYEITVNYQAQNNTADSRGNAYMYSHAQHFREILSDKVALNLYNTQQSFSIKLKHSVSDLQVRINDDETKDFTIDNVTIKRVSSAGVIAGNIIIALLFIIIAGVAAGKLIRKEYSVQQVTIAACLFMIVILASIALGVYGFITPDNNSDLPFHLERVQGIYEGIKNGNVPARLYNFYLNGYGYPNGIYYGDTLLYIPAVLHLIGYSMTASFKIYILIIHALTAFIAYWSLKEVTNRYEAGLLGSALYTLAPYRLACVYYRLGVGEYTAMTFFPLIICGLWLIYMGSKEQQKRGIIALVVGSSGIIQSHILSVILIGLSGIAFMTWFFKRTFQKSVMLSLGKVLIGIAALNLWFIVPMADCMLTQSINIKSAGIQRIQCSGKGIAELAAIDVSYPISSIGIVMLIIPILFCAVILINHYSNCQYRWKKESIGIAALGVGFLFLSTNYFPYDALCKNSTLINQTIGKIQFTWRWIGITGLFFTILMCFILDNLYQVKKQFYYATMLGMAVLISGAAVSLETQLINRFGASYYYSGDAIDYEGYGHSLYYQVVAGEYLLEGTDLDEVGKSNKIIDETNVVTESKRNGNVFTIQVNNQGKKETQIELPLLNYKGYTVKGENGKALLTRSGTNNRMAVIIPEDYNGSVHTAYTGMWYWRISDMISLICLVAVLGYIWYGKRQNKILRKEHFHIFS